MKMDQILEQVDSAIGIADDVVVYAKSEEEHDFWLFSKLKEKLIGCHYETIEEMKEAVTNVIDMLTQKDFHGAFQKLWNGTTSTLQLEEITSKGTRDSCVYYQ